MQKLKFNHFNKAVFSFCGIAATSYLYKTGILMTAADFIKPVSDYLTSQSNYFFNLLNTFGKDILTVSQQLLKPDLISPKLPTSISNDMSNIIEEQYDIYVGKKETMDNAKKCLNNIKDKLTQVRNPLQKNKFDI